MNSIHRSTISILLWTLLLLGSGSATWAEDFGSPHPDAPPELLEFGFLVGPWNCEIEWPQADGSRGKGVGTWIGRWMMDGWAIRDDFRDGFYEGFRATTFRSWDARERAWRGFWLDGRSGAWSRPLVEESTQRGLRLRTSMSTANADGQSIEVEMRYHFHEIAERNFSWRQDTSVDGGVTWKEATTTIECERPAAWRAHVAWKRPGESKAKRINATEQGLAVGGYDVVSYHLEDDARLGAIEYESEYESFRYRFVSADNLKRFQMDPERYLPAYGGYCAYGFALDPETSGGWKPGPYPVDPESYLVEDGRLLLFFRGPAFDARQAYLKDLETLRQRADHYWSERPPGS